MKMKITEIGPKLKSIIAEESAELFETRWPNLLACFSAGEIFRVIGSYLQIEGLPQEVLDDYSCATVCKATQDAFITLLTRGALDEFVAVNPLPPAAAAELDRMAGVAPALIDPVIEARTARATALDECVLDFRGRLDARAFKNKWLTGDPTRRAVYESACAPNRI
jgi:hypothetical protein